MSTNKKNKISTDGGSFSQTGVFDELKFNDLLDGSLKANSRSSDIKTLHKKPRGRVEVRREKAGRGGKTVTSLKAFPNNISQERLELMTYEFKKLCACGGTLKDRTIELQGDVCDQVCDKLRVDGFEPVRAGG